MQEYLIPTRRLARAGTAEADWLVACQQELARRSDRLAFAIRDGMPVLLEQEARSLPDDDALLHRAMDEAISRKPKGHDFIIDRRHSGPAVPRHMSVTGG